MQPYKLRREIQVFEKDSDIIVSNNSLPNLDAKDLVLIFGHQVEDPHFYGGYELNERSAVYFPDLRFDFIKYNYYVVCWRELTGQELEILTINSFFKKDKAKRYVSFVLDPALRPKFISSLAHLKDLNLEKFQEVRYNEIDQIMEVVGRAKLDSCYAISQNKRIDGQFLDSHRALEETIGYGMGTLLVFGSDAKVVYYEGEEMHDRWISL
jgi:hypothetical protein